MTSPFRRNVELSGATMRRRVRERFSEPNSLRAVLASAQAGRLTTWLEADDFGRVEVGRRLLEHRFTFAGEELRASPRSLWKATPPSAAWRATAHGFEWLDDLAAIGDAGAGACAAALVDAWSHNCGDYHPINWSVGVAARRLRAWLLHTQMIQTKTGDNAASRIETFERSVWAHADWLMRHLNSLGHGMDRLRAAIAVTTAGLAIEGWEARRAAIDAMLRSAVSGAMLEDGGVLSRSPEDAFVALSQLLLLSEHHLAAGVASPEYLEPAIQALTGAVRFFRMPDGGLALFHGGGTLDDGRIDTVLTRARVKTEPPKRLTDSGFERLSGGRVAVLLDVGRSPEGPAAETAHGSTMALEMSTGRRRLVVNCGSGAHLDDNWRRACRGPAAHSTLVVDNTPFAKPILSRGAFVGEEDRALVGPPEVAAERKDERNGVWAMCAHDGYLESHGITVTRRLFLSADGGDFRGEDRLHVEDEGERAFDRRVARLPRDQRDKGVPFVARFHLHPEVSAAIVAEGEAVTLRLPHGEVWVMRQAGGALSLEASVYLDRHEPARQTKQIVITGGAKERDTVVRWAFRRVGELSQLPKDVDALLREIDAAEREERRQGGPEPLA